MLLKSSAKLNLTLDVLGLLPGGFHAIETIFQSVSLYDELHFDFLSQNLEQSLQSEISVSLALTSGIEKQAPEKQIDFPLQADNLIVRAAQLFSTRTGLGKDLSMRVAVNKNIPIAAGLAGGSGNAAATLVALNAHYGNKLSKVELCDLSAKLGSDIGFFIYGGTCIGRQRGEVLEPLTGTMTLQLIIVKPRDIAISTPWIYKTFDQYLTDGKIHKEKSKLTDCVLALQAGDLTSVVKSVGNNFEAVVYAEHPVVKQIQQKMLELGCLNANVSGSGPTLYGLLESFKSGEHIKETLLKSTFKNHATENQSLDLDYNGAEILDVWVVQSTKQAIEVITP